jgi:hypothetical protein
MTQSSKTECCPVFDPKPWDKTKHTFKDKKFIKDEVKQFLHMPINYGQVITGMMQKIEAVGAKAVGMDFLMLSYDPSPWKSELYVSTTKEVPGAENVTISGNFVSKVYDGPFNQVPKWLKDMQKYVATEGLEAKKYYFYYTTCPKCAKKCGHNYIVVLAQV